jgi:hypothetical protein
MTRNLVSRRMRGYLLVSPHDAEQSNAAVKRLPDLQHAPCVYQARPQPLL